jgi:hypothetical protein
MALQLEQLGRAFAAETEHAFTVWTLATPEPLAAVLAPGYFTRCLSRFRLGDLVLCGARQPSTAPSVPWDANPDRQRCLLMVTRLAWDGVEVRVVQDWGSPLAPAAMVRAREGARAGKRWRPGVTGWSDAGGSGQRPRSRRLARAMWRGAAGWPGVGA